jgi:NAD(P)-dependent dehydrogenase (short-subunit alcohol dehydrogenase family)
MWRRSSDDRHGRARVRRVDILVNNAGIQHVAPVEQFPVEAWDKIIAINLSAVFHSSRLALPGMRARGWGRIINIASVHGLVGSTGKAAYVAAKHGVVGLTKVIGLETATSNVTCNAICPGWVLTPLVQKQIDDRAANGGDPQQAQHDLLAENSLRWPSSHPVTSASWYCSCAARPAARFAAPPGTSMAAGSPSEGGRRAWHGLAFVYLQGGLMRQARLTAFCP